MEQLGGVSEASSGLWLFADDRPNSTLSNLELVKKCRADVLRVRFLDFAGSTWICEITSDIEVKSRASSRAVQRDEATIDLRKVGPT